VLVAIIGALGVIIAAWIGARVRRRGKEREEQVRQEFVGRDKIGGDVVRGSKVETHEQIYFGDSEGERKNAFVYFLEKLFAFIFTFVFTGLIFGGIGYAVGQEVGAAIGLLLALIAAIVNAGNVKRTKGIF